MIFYVTGNLNKVNTANSYLKKYEIELVQKTLKDAVEIQSNNIEEISVHKAKQSYEFLKSPLVVNDSGWEITALNGFPGPYMSFMNKWLTAEDLLKLMSGKENREVFLEEVVTYIDENGVRVFRHKIPGHFLKEIQGEGIASDRMISLSGDGKSISYRQQQGLGSHNHPSLWDEFGEWFSKR